MAFTPSWNVSMTLLSNLSILCTFSIKFEICKDTDLGNGEYKGNFIGI